MSNWKCCNIIVSSSNIPSWYIIFIVYYALKACTATNSSIKDGLWTSNDLQSTYSCIATHNKHEVKYLLLTQCIHDPTEDQANDYRSHIHRFAYSCVHRGGGHVYIASDVQRTGYTRAPLLVVLRKNDRCAALSRGNSTTADSM